MTTPAEQEVTNLPPCPFCRNITPNGSMLRTGLKVKRDPVAYLEPYCWIVLCLDCGACGANKESREAAIEAWSRRAATHAADGQAALTWDEVLRVAKNAMVGVEVAANCQDNPKECRESAQHIIDRLEAAASPVTAPHEPRYRAVFWGLSKFSLICRNCGQDKGEHSKGDLFCPHDPIHGIPNEE